VWLAWQDGFRTFEWEVMGEPGVVVGEVRGLLALGY